MRVTGPWKWLLPGTVMGIRWKFWLSVSISQDVRKKFQRKISFQWSRLIVWVEPSRRMYSVLNKLSLTRSMLLKVIQQNYRSTIYSKPPKEKIGPVVRMIISFSSCEWNLIDRHPCFELCIKMYYNSMVSVFTCTN